MVPQDRDGKYIGPRKTYRSGGNVVAAAGTLPFLVINGAAGTVMRIQRIRLTGFTLTAVAYLRTLLQKHSSAWTAGTPVNPTETPVDSAYGAAGAPLGSITPYTAGPTGGGALVGPLAEAIVLGQATVAVAAGFPSEVLFDFSNQKIDAPTLRAAAENLALSFAAAPATAVTLSWEVEWTEDGN
jgi:hypothetical protein